jgi:hypothetical protein
VVDDIFADVVILEHHGLERPRASRGSGPRRAAGSSAAARPDRVERWIIDQGLRGVSLEDLVDGFCERVVDAGFPARRFSMIIGTLHPRHGARSYVWRPTGLETEAFARRRTDEDSAAYLRSPIYYLRQSGEAQMRRRLDTGEPCNSSCSRSCAMPA